MKDKRILILSIIAAVLFISVLITAGTKDPEPRCLFVEIRTFSVATEEGQPKRYVYIVRWVDLAGEVHEVDFSNDDREKALTIYEYLAARQAVEKKD